MIGFRAMLASMAALGAVGLASPALAQSARKRDAGEPVPSMPALPPAVIDDALAIGGQAIDGRKLRTRMTVAVKVNDTGPYRFVVDSGADTSVVGERLAATLALPAKGRVFLNGVTDSAYVDSVGVEQLSVGPTTVYDLKVPVLKEAHLGAAGMIGLDALVEQRLMLDFEKRTISVDDASRPQPRMDGEIVVTARLKRGQLILTQVKAGAVAVDAVVDTGSEITIGNTALRDKLFKRFRNKFEEIEVLGVTGAPAKLQLVRVPSLRLGSVVLTNVPIAFADVPPFQVFGIAGKPSLLLGTDLMELFRRVSLDFRARKVRFQLRRCEAVGVRISTIAQSSSRLLGEAPAVCN